MHVEQSIEAKGFTLLLLKQQDKMLLYNIPLFGGDTVLWTYFEPYEAVSNAKNHHIFWTNWYWLFYGVNVYIYMHDLVKSLRCCTEKTISPFHPDMHGVLKGKQLHGKSTVFNKILTTESKLHYVNIIQCFPKMEMRIQTTNQVNDFIRGLWTQHAFL